MDPVKLSHAAQYFVANTRDCQRIKLCRLLFLFDFRVYWETGKSVTGARYMDSSGLPPDVVPDYNQPFDEALFTRRELRILQDLAEAYRETSAELMVEVVPQLTARYLTKDQIEAVEEEAREAAALFT